MKNFFGALFNFIKKHKIITALIIILIIVAIVLSILYFNSSKRNMQGFNLFSRINTINLEKMDLTTSVSATGTFESAETISISSTLSNVEILDVHVSEGQSVKKGQILLTFDKETLNEELERAKEDLETIQTQINANNSQAKRQVESAKETYEQKKNLAKASLTSAKNNYSDIKKQVEKLKKEISSTTDATTVATLNQQLSTAKTNLSMAKSEYDKAVLEQSSINKQNYTNLENAKNQMELTALNGKKTLRDAKNKVEDIKTKLQKTEVKASIAGTVTSVAVSAGDVYNGGILVEISDCEQFNIVTTVDEYDISKIEKGQKVIILTDSTDNVEFEGEVTYVALTKNESSSIQQMNGMNQSSSSSSGYTVKIKVNGTDERLRIGMTAKCSIIQEQKEQVFAVPYDAIHKNSFGQDVIYVLDVSQSAYGNGSKYPSRGEVGGGRPSMRDRGNFEQENNEQNFEMFAQKEIVVEKGMESDYYVEIISDELEESMKVIIPSDETSTESQKESEKSGFGMIGGGMPGSGMPGGRMPGGRMPR